jgi:predicted metalloprotease with PDZ domain
MNITVKSVRQRTAFSLLALALFFTAASAQSPIYLTVDATDAAKNILHVAETMPVKPGPFALFYPKWIPGEHSPTGTINDMVDLRITADGKPVEWQRDDVEMFAFHLTVPRGAKMLTISFDDVSQPGTTMTSQLARIKWNRLILYPRGSASDSVQVAAVLRKPSGWNYATALPVAKETGDLITFRATELTKFIDSPAILGRHFAKIPLTASGTLAEMDIAAETEEALKYRPETLAGWKDLVVQANRMFGAHHYDSYKFLLTLSDNGGSEGLEHHESSEDGTFEKALSENYAYLDLSDLLGHEYAHSWNGKYRRPATLTTPDFEKPMQGELLWVYEGLTQYLGHVLPTRCGLWNDEMFRESIAETAASMDHQSGRRWRPLVDTARAVQYTYSSPRAWLNVRRRVDYYDEGSLIWLEADVLIRQHSNGKLSLDDFLQKFHGGKNSGPKVVTYDLAEIVRTLNTVVRFDWEKFFTDRVYRIQDRAPLGGITNGGWTLIYNSTPNIQGQVDDFRRSSTSFMYSLGIMVNEDGAVPDIDPDLAAAKAGIAPGMTIKKVNGETFSIDALKNAVAASADKPVTILLEVENGTSTAEVQMNYEGGEKYPHLVRNMTMTDYLSGITKPR